jgi:large subunit ribosomal protein L4
MTTVDIIRIDGKKAGSVDLPAELFDVPANIPLMHQVVVAQLAAARQGTHKTKTRGEVRGGGHKPWRQKGTGRARQGSRRAPQWKGGGVVHGPVPRDYSQRTPKKMKKAALRGALSDRARNGRLHVVEGFVDGETPSTKAAIATLRKLTDATRVLVVLGEDDRLNWLSLRNEPTVHLLEVGQLNTYDVLVSDEVIFTTEALSAFAGVEPDLSEVEDEVEADDEPAGAKPEPKKSGRTKSRRAAAKETEAASDEEGDE